MKQHHYNASIIWTGNQGKGTATYSSYSRDYTITISGKSAKILGSSDPSFRGDPARYNPEDLFLASLAGCHMLWYLHLCSQNGIIVLDYKDSAKGVMQEDSNGKGRFTSVTLFPEVIISDSSKIELANHLHADANSMCFIANSCNFKIAHQPSCIVKD